MGRASQFLSALLLAAIFAGLFPAGIGAQGTPERSELFGVIESYESPSHADRLKVGWTRVIFNWAEVQADGENSWTPRISEEQIDAEIEAGRMVVGLLIGIPDWAMTDDKLPQGLWLEHQESANLWARFVERIVNSYRGRIDHWIIWNEPDIQESALAHSWNGNVADFAQLQRIAYLTAKAANPAAVIHLPAFTYWADYEAGTEQYMARLLDEIQKDPQAPLHNHYFDVATAHLYFQPAQIYDLLILFTELMRERGLQQPIWLVETNAPPKDDPQWSVANWTLSVTQQEQAAFMPQAMALALAAGAEKIGVYKLKDTEDDRTANPEPFGLVRADGSERPAFATYRLAVGYLSGTFRAARERWDAIGQIRLEQNGQFTTLIFSRLPEWKTVEIKASSEQAQLVDMWGTKRVITPTNGVYTVNLNPASCSHSIGDYCMIGGPVHYLIQAADIVPPSPSPTPASTLTPSATSTMIPSPTQTASATLFPAPSATLEPSIVSTPTAQQSHSATIEVALVLSPSVENTPVPISPASTSQKQDNTDLVLPLLISGGVIVVLIMAFIFSIRYKSKRESG